MVLLRNTITDTYLTIFKFFTYLKRKYQKHARNLIPTMDFLANQDGVTGKSMSLEGLDWMFYLDDSSKSHLSMLIWVVEIPRVVYKIT